jgi:hypothetical protein
MLWHEVRVPVATTGVAFRYVLDHELIVEGLMRLRTDWLLILRLLTQYVAPVLVLLGLIVELTGFSFGSAGLDSAYNHFGAIVFSLLTVVMISACGWILFLWDIDRLFFRLESKIDTELAQETHVSEQTSVSLLGRIRETVNSKVQSFRALAVAAIEKAYWNDINAGGVLAFPQPDIAAAVERIDESRRDLLAPLASLVETKLPLGATAASLAARMVFRYVAPEVKVRLYRRLVVRFLSQLGALFVLTALCFYLSILGWSRVSGSVFSQGDVSTWSIALYQLDLMLRGALFDFMEHTQRSISPIRIDQNATVFVYYTLLFRMFVAIYVVSSLFRVARFVAREWRALVR